MDTNALDIIIDFDEQEYKLDSIGILNICLVFEYDSIYFYATDSDFYFDVNNSFVDYIVDNNIIVLKDDEYSFVFNEEQSILIKNIFKDIVNDNYRKRLTETF